MTPPWERLSVVLSTNPDNFPLIKTTNNVVIPNNHHVKIFGFMKHDIEANAAQKEEFAEKGYYTYSENCYHEVQSFLMERNELNEEDRKRAFDLKFDKLNAAYLGAAIDSTDNRILDSFQENYV